MPKISEIPTPPVYNITGLTSDELQMIYISLRDYRKELTRYEIPGEPPKTNLIDMCNMLLYMWSDVLWSVPIDK